MSSTRIARVTHALTRENQAGGVREKKRDNARCKKKTNIEGGCLERTLVYLEATSGRRRLRATHGETGRCHFCTVQYKTPNRKVRPKISRRVQRHHRLRAARVISAGGRWRSWRWKRKKRRRKEEEAGAAEEKKERTRKDEE
ncbi:hypothetical protein ALC62_11812 [Cyphomyrmex costatus]|uniref:Uncharacterized protein n=1 Tax=Cyphomyrmex costatus TaxID=456900 RepID=A0A195CBN0_9HYME|nr:hypothetical protein ALC62_11812 [Cyphomyrmex costatus]